MTLHTKIKGRCLEAYDESGKPYTKMRVFDTTPGRMMLGELLPIHPKVPFDVVPTS